MYEIENQKTANIRRLLAETNATIPVKRQEIETARAERAELVLALEDAEAREDLGFKTEADIPSLEKQLRAKNTEIEKLENSAKMLSTRVMVLEGEVARLVDEAKDKLGKTLLSDLAKLVKEIPGKLEALEKAREAYGAGWHQYGEIVEAARGIGLKLPEPDFKSDKLKEIYDKSKIWDFKRWEG